MFLVNVHPRIFDRACILLYVYLCMYVCVYIHIYMYVYG